MVALHFNIRFNYGGMSLASKAEISVNRCDRRWKHIPSALQYIVVYGEHIVKYEMYKLYHFSPI
jgi:hypothetical protein